MRVMHGRPTHDVGRNVGKKVMGTLGAVALAAGLLSGCGDGQEPPADTAATSSPSPEESTPGQDPGAEEQEPEASPSEPSPEASGDGADEGTDDGAGEGADNGSGAPDDAEADAEGGSDGKRDDSPSEEDDGTSDGKGKDGDKESQDEEPEKPDYIEYGEVSDRVGTLQQRLKDLGYFVTSVDDAYGSETQQAIFALQKAGGLYRDGVVGDATQKAADDGVVPRARTSSGKVLEIDIDRQLVLAVENGQVVKTINASSGNGETYEAQGTTYTAYTPRGSFAVYREVNAMHSSTLELGDMWRPKFFTGGIAVHGSASVPAFPASHGCVRVSNSAMDWIWDTWGAPSGTPVVVY
ncbi:L,D-transpeptidase family protein [Promicromonospora iranensis]|uniref:Lipoprotein-anchoring transpeptidase ErfK/SrfK n=1 Tax=Promicromonospora iranensis TaxID=1105144 RepID=A0ABU2CMQ0_9MICO|nr:L,D-transpeptidase family protein [Promicromonospora iranensis]MDR7382603.1 lipoprotein-anchoring transpeptidase ErfK/SrfK [Promicromonospora iranensis]